MRALLLLLALAGVAHGQIFSPKVLRAGQPDSTSLESLAQSIYAQAGARTPRERAEAVWRFFLTDGRFVKPGFWYHIAGWAYEEPEGEVLDPLKLMNSYGFGLCYQIAPVLEAVWKAGGFEDARVWFLTGHTVAEVFYDHGYHHFDSDMMGYNTEPDGRVASVHEIENDGRIILNGPRGVNPWYPADVRAGAIPGLAELFTTRQDNWLFPFERAPGGHTMDFVLRPGERIIRYFHPERDRLYYLPYRFDGREWHEFPNEIAQYHIRTEDGPRCEKDARRWATGRIEYRPPLDSGTVEVRSPYVIIGAEFGMTASLGSADALRIETSSDGGRSWQLAGERSGPYSGKWTVQPAVLTQSEHGRRTAVSGRYGYLVRIARTGAPKLSELLLTTHFQLNPRTLPELTAGRNELVYSAGLPRVRRRSYDPPVHVSNARQIDEGGQSYWVAAGPGDLVFRLSGVSGFHAGGRFLDLSRGLAPDKFTAEVRKIAALPARPTAASLDWSASPTGPFQPLWTFDPRLTWKDGKPIDHTLLWPEVDRHVALEGTRDVYVRYRFNGMALDSLRLFAETVPAAVSKPLIVTHQWKENAIPKSATRRIPPGAAQHSYTIETAPAARIENQALILECQ